MICVKLDVQLSCPECGGQNLFIHSALATGQRVECEFCGTPLVVGGRDATAQRRADWRLEKPSGKQAQRAG